MSDTDHQPSRTRVPMPVAALSDPHMGDAAKNPERAEKIIGAILFVSVICFGVAGAAYWQAWSPWTFGGALGAGLFALGFGLTAWGKYLMPQGPFVEERHTLASSPDERDAMAAALIERLGVVVKRRRVLGRPARRWAWGLRDRGRVPADALPRPGARRLLDDDRLAQGHGPGRLQRPAGPPDPCRRRHHDRLSPHGPRRTPTRARPSTRPC